MFEAFNRNRDPIEFKKNHSPKCPHCGKFADTDITDEGEYRLECSHCEQVFDMVVYLVPLYDTDLEVGDETEASE